MTRRCLRLTHTGFVIPFIAFFVVSVLNACGNKKEVVTSQVAKAVMMYEPDVPTSSWAEAMNNDNQTTASGAYADIPKKIIREARLNYAVDDLKRSRKRLSDIIGSSGGSVISESERRLDGRLESKLEIRVPSGKFDSCLNVLTEGDDRLFGKEIFSTDVTEDYVDMSARMKARKEVELRYLDILKQARTVADVLKVEEQLKAIREEVEAAQGRLQYIDHNVSMSLIHISLTQFLSGKIPQGPGFFSRIFISMKDGWNSVLGAIVGFAGLWPLWIATVALFLIIRRYRKSRRLRKLAA